jgi:MarR family transcriptional regulator, 2-MHQ and catechol-resistance regulon repressor
LETLENVVWRSLADTYRTVYFHINADLRTYGLTPPQYAVLRIIGKSKRGALPMNEIGKEMIVTFANITTIVDNLERRGLVNRVRDTSDRRVVNVELTNRGSHLFSRILTAHRKNVATLMRVLSQKELQNLLVLTTKIKENISVAPFPKKISAMSETTRRRTLIRK